MEHKNNLASDIRCLAVRKMVFDHTLPGKAPNDFEPRNTPGEHLRKDGVLYVNDVCYGQDYPNSYVDIWYASEDKTVKRPTVLDMHGGGFIFGDKVMGDPLADTEAGDAAFYLELLKEGCNVVSMNYCFAPEYRFPAQIRQLDQCLCYLKAHAEELGLDMERVFVGGGSAGACFSEVYGAVLVSTEYADFIGIHPAFPRENIRGLILNEPSLSMRLYEENMNALYGCWLGADTPSEKPEEIRKLDVPSWLSDDYFPTMLIASNVEEVFYDSAKVLSDKLESIKTPCDFFYRSREDAGDLPHGFIGNFKTNEASKECMDHLKAFLHTALQEEN